MTVEIRLMGTDPAELDAAEAAIREVMVVPAAARDYPSRRRRPDGTLAPTIRRYLTATRPTVK